MKNTMSVREKRKDEKQGMNELEEGEEKEGWRGRWEEGETCVRGCSIEGEGKRTVRTMGGVPSGFESHS